MFTNQKAYKQVMFTKQNKTIQNRKFTNTLYIYNYNLQISYVYKTKTFTDKLFTKQNRKFTKEKQNNKFTNTICLQNKTKNKTKNKMFKSLCHFTTFSVFHRDDFVNFTYFYCLHAITLSSCSLFYLVGVLTSFHFVTFHSTLR